MKIANPKKLSKTLRAKIAKFDEEKVFLTQFKGSEQEKDLTKSPNCEGYGRVHHFRRWANPNRGENPLPMDPASRKLNIAQTDEIAVQLFQVGGCNFRCWYCFVDDVLLNINKDHGDYLSAKEIIDLYQKEENRSPILDLSGGHPGLIPEWGVWMMQEIISQGLEKEIYIWEDDNLSTDFLWQFLSDDQLELLTKYDNYGRVGCFKGFDEVSFSFNSSAPPEFFQYQFEIMSRLFSLGLDVYAYVTFTTPDIIGVNDKISRFMDKLQGIRPDLPLRTVPLEIRIFRPTLARIKFPPNEVLANQYIVNDIWKKELQKRLGTGQNSDS